MKKNFIFAIVMILVFSCGKKIKDRDSLSPVREANQATQELISSVNSWAESRNLSEMSQEEFTGYIYSVNPNLDRDVIRDLTNFNKIEPGEKVSLRYHYFDQEGLCKMEDSKGKFTKVSFRNEIVVEVIRPTQEKLWIAISCLNGMLDIVGEPGLSGNALTKFTIEKGQGLSRYLADDYWSINVAEEFNLPLFKGKKQSQDNRITPEQARELIPENDKTQISVYVEEGWVFIFSEGQWSLNGLTPEQFR